MRATTKAISDLCTCCKGDLFTTDRQTGDVAPCWCSESTVAEAFDFAAELEADGHAGWANGLRERLRAIEAEDAREIEAVAGPVPL